QSAQGGAGERPAGAERDGPLQRDQRAEEAQHHEDPVGGHRGDGVVDAGAGQAGPGAEQQADAAAREQEEAGARHRRGGGAACGGAVGGAVAGGAAGGAGSGTVGGGARRAAGHGSHPSSSRTSAVIMSGLHGGSKTSCTVTSRWPARSASAASTACSR